MSWSRSVQEEGAGAEQAGAQPGPEAHQAGVHGPAAPHAPGHLQGEPPPFQRAAGHHLSAAGPGALHRQQLLHERPPTQPQQVGRRGPPVLHGLLGLQHFLLGGVVRHGVMTAHQRGAVGREKRGHMDWSEQRPAVINVLLFMGWSDGASCYR